MGLAVDYFYTLTPREFDNACAGFRRVQEQQMQSAWNQTRMIMWAALAPHQKKGVNLTPEKLLQFAWEKNTGLSSALSELTDEQISKIRESAAEWERIDTIRQIQN